MGGADLDGAKFLNLMLVGFAVPSQVPTVIGVTHNYFHQVGDATQGGGVYGLIPTNVTDTLDNGPGFPTYDAYVATSPSQWKRTSSHYCCTAWQTGCA